MVNGLRDLRTKSDEATIFQQITGRSNVKDSPFLSILIIGIFVTAVSILSLLYQIYMIEINKAEILSLYALLQMNEITKVYQESNNYMEILNQGSMIND
jgi:hypothetical protein